MFAGALAAVNGIAGNEDLLALTGASVGLAAGFALVRWHGARHRRDPDFQPILFESPASLAQPLTLS
jgi:positive regulator of sigma E activity